MDLEEVILVDLNDGEVGTASKAEAHRRGGALHRAFSVVLMNERGEVLLQQRAAGKYHFAGRWSNACCGHPRPGEPTAVAAQRRLFEELGVTAELRSAGTFVYRAEDPISGLVEHELDHVWVGTFEGEPNVNPSEAADWAWMSVNELRDDMRRRADRYTPWLAHVLRTVFST